MRRGSGASYDRSNVATTLESLSFWRIHNTDLFSYVGTKVSFHVDKGLVQRTWTVGAAQ